MNTINFKRRAVATAVSAVLTAGMTGVAYANTLNPVVTTAPTLDGTKFVPAQNAKLQADGNYGAAQTQDVTFEVVYLDDTNAQINIATVVDSTLDNVLDASLTAGDPGSATKAVMLLTVPAGDDFGAGTSPRITVHQLGDHAPTAQGVTHGGADNSAF